MLKHRLSAAAAIVLLTAAGPVSAQSSPPPSSSPVQPSPPAAPGPTPAAPEGFGGPVIPGVCLLSRDAVFARSAVGQAASARLKQLGQKAQATLDAERRRLEGEAKALQGQQASLPPDQVQRRQQQIQARAQALQVSAGQASRELEATRASVMGKIETAIQPVAMSVYQAKGCGLLLSKEAVLGGNMANDLTDAVVQGLNAKMTTISFEREHLPPAPSAAEPR